MSKRLGEGIGKGFTNIAMNKQASPLTRVTLLAYLSLIVYASWYPFTGWHNAGVSPFAYLPQPLPRYWTFFDVSIDIVGYLPLGVLLVLACYPRLSRTQAALFSFVTGTLISAAMEAIQTYLPSRVSSNLDLMTNSLGVFIGVVAGYLLTPILLEKDLLGQVRGRWCVPSVSNGLIILALWPLAQIYPQGYLFGLGQLTPVISNWITVYLDIPIDLGEILRQGASLSIEQYWLSETIVTCFGMINVVLIFLCLLRGEAPRLRLVTMLIGTALIIKSLAMALLFWPEQAYSWFFSPGAQAGLIVGFLMLYGLAFIPSGVQRHLAIFTLIVSLLVINMVPGNPYFIDTLSTWNQGKFLNFDGAAHFLSVLWPWLALWFLLQYRPDSLEKR